MSDNMIGLVVLGCIVAVALFGGVKNSQNSGGLFSTQPQTQTTVSQNASIESQVQTAQNQVDNLKKEIALLEDEKTRSKYNGLVDLQFVNRGSNASQEYLVLHMNTSTTTVPVTGWIIKSLKSGNSVSIPKAAYLIFDRSVSTEDPIILSGNDTVYVITGVSPVGYSFKLNKCSGYMSQFQNFTPYLYTQCPAPRNENLSSIPQTVNNDACFDFIEAMPSCRIQNTPLPVGLSGECQNFIYNKINYGTCIDVHKYDKDFYLSDWRVYLGRSERLWKDRRETIVLYDNAGKIVDSLTY